MITKITKDNELEFFKRGFDAITAAFAADDSLPNIVVNSLESYYGNLQYIKQLKTEKGEQGKFLLVPFDEPFFEIDANARTIKVPDAFKKNGVAVQGDHQAELLVFKVDRYFDYQDLFETDIAINWNFVPYGQRQASLSGHDAVFAKTLYYDANYVIFGFVLTSEVTPSRGTLNFSVNFYQIGEGENAFNYSLNTMIASVNVNEGLVLENPSEVKKVNQSFIGRLGNSAYTPEQMAPIANPEWTTGDKDEEGNFLGLPKKKNFEDNEESLILNARAHVVGANVKYTWEAAPVLESNGDLLVEDVEQVTEITDPNRATIPEDYFATSDTIASASKEYFIKDESGKIDAEHPLTGEDAQEKLDDEDVIVYELGNAYIAKMAGSYKVSAQGELRTTVNATQELIASGNSINSNTCIIPVAAKPFIKKVEATGVSANDFVDETPEGEINPYTYVAGSAPEVVVSIELAEGETEALNLVAAQIVLADTGAITLADAAALNYQELVNGQLTLSNVPSGAGRYKVRVINKKNHTYRISEPSDELQFSEIATRVTNLTIGGKVEGSAQEEKNVIVNGVIASDHEIEGSENGAVLFTITDNTVNKLGETTYFVEEVNNQGEVKEDGLNIEVINNEQFTIPQGATGIFRVRTENRYHNSMREGIVGNFIVNAIGQ